MRRIALEISVASLVIVLAACGPAHVELPTEMCGRWVTDDARYAGRYLELSNERIRFGIGDTAIESFEVVKIRKTGKGAQVRYDITYLDVAGDESVFSLDHLITRGSIRFVNSPERRWTKAAPPGSE